MTQLELLRQVIVSLESANIPYAIVGSFASSIWGEPRMTRDVDLIVQLALSQVDGLVDDYPPPEFYVSRAAIEEAIRFKRPFNVIQTSTAHKIDFMVIGETPWAHAQIARRRRIKFLPDLEGFVAAPDDVILGKLIYFREGGSEKHVRDIAGILNRSGDLVDRDYLLRNAEQLGVADILRRIETP